jgi:hypothetical protein
MRLTADEIDEIWQSLSIGEDEIDMHEYAEAIETAVLAKLEAHQLQPVPAENCLWARNGNAPCSGTQPALLKDYGLCPQCHSRTVTRWHGYDYCELGHRYLNSATSR